jgi:hypothetical protein
MRCGAGVVGVGRERGTRTPPLAARRITRSPVVAAFMSDSRERGS